MFNPGDWTTQDIFIMVAIEYRRKRLQNNAFLRDKKSPMKMNPGFLMYTVTQA
jgi:hypothetical protein